MNFISEDFHLHYIGSYTLYIQSNLNNDYIVVLSAEKEVLIFLQYDNLVPSIEATRILSLPFSKVIIGMVHQNLIWAPTDVFKEEDKELYLPYFLSEKVEAIFHKEIQEIDAVALYEFDQVAYRHWLKIFPEAKIVPSFEVLLQQANQYVSKNGVLLGVHIMDNQADIFLFVNGEFKLYNTFEVISVDDLNYFVLSIMKNFSLDARIEKVVLSGNKDEEWAQRLLGYSNELIVLEAKSSWTTVDHEVNVVLKSLNVLSDTVLCV